MLRKQSKSGGFPVTSVRLWPAFGYGMRDLNAGGHPPASGLLRWRARGVPVPRLALASNTLEVPTCMASFCYACAFLRIRIRPLLLIAPRWKVYGEGKCACCYQTCSLIISTSWDEKWHWNLGNRRKCFKPILPSSTGLTQWAHKNRNPPVKKEVISRLQFQTN